MTMPDSSALMGLGASGWASGSHVWRGTTGLKEVEEGAPILVPTGGGTFVNANLGNLSNILVNIGADVSIEMDLDQAQEDIAGRLDEIQKAGQSVQQQLEEILAQMQIRRDALNRLSAGLGGEAPGV